MFYQAFKYITEVPYMLKIITFVFLFVILNFSNNILAAEIQQSDSITSYLQNKIKKTSTDSCSYYFHQLIKHSRFVENDSILIRTHQNLAKFYKKTKQTDSSLSHLKRSLQIKNIKAYPSLEVRTHLLIGSIYQVRPDYKKTLKHFKIALNISDSFHFEKEKAISLLQIGNTHWQQDYYQKALQFYIKANKTIEQSNFKSLKISVLLSMSNIYVSEEQWDKATLILNKALLLSKKNKDTYRQSIINNNLGGIHEAQKQYKKALTYHYESLKLRKLTHTTRGLISNYHNLGTVHFYLGDYKQALEYITKSQTLAVESASKLDYVYNFEYFARIYTEFGNFKKAEKYLKQSKELARELDLKRKMIDLVRFESDYLFKKRNFTAAKSAFVQYDSLKSDFIKNDKSERIIQMQALYETEKTEKENELLKTQKQLAELNLEKEINRKELLIIGLALSLSLLILIIFLLRNMMIANKENRRINLKLEESNEKLQLINNTKDKFFSIIAHDLRSPLGAILSFSNLIDIECSSSKEIEAVTECNSYLNQSARNLNSLLENLLQWSKSQLGSINYQPTAFNLSEIIDENIEIQKLKAKEKSIKIVSHVEKNIVVHADINMINTVIRNLLSNAIKFSYQKSEINIFIEIEGNTLNLSVQDKGIGISQDKQKELFYIESNKSTLGTNNETGTGLGLILCKEFVETNGGVISIKSEENKGSIFTFSISLYDA